MTGFEFLAGTNLHRPETTTPPGRGQIILSLSARGFTTGKDRRVLRRGVRRSASTHVQADRQRADGGPHGHTAIRAAPYELPKRPRECQELRISRRAVPGSEASSITLIRGETAFTAAFDGQMAMDADELQYQRIAAAAAARGLFAVVATTQDSPEAERVAVQSLLHRRVDGIIRATAGIGSPLSFDGDSRQVLVLRTDGIHPASIGDDHLGGYLATGEVINFDVERCLCRGNRVEAGDRRGGQ